MAKLQTTCFSFVLLALRAGRSCSGAEQTGNGPSCCQKMAFETVECAAYFDIVSLALLHSNEDAQEYLKARKKAVDRAESLSQGIVGANYDVMIKEMKNKIVLSNTTKQIDQSLSNVSITGISLLGYEYAKLCKEVLRDPGARAKYWMEHIGTSQ
jgi:hypothetical protein